MLQNNTESEKKMKNTIKGTNPIKKFFTENQSSLIVMIALVIFLSVNPITGQSFLQLKNVQNIFRQISTNVILACGMTMVIILGGIDLSVGSIMAISGCLAAGCVINHSMPVFLAMLIGVLVGTCFGIFNGFIISNTSIQPFIVTLTTMNIARGLAKVYTGGSPLSVSLDSWKLLGTGYFLGIPIVVWIMAIILLLTALLMYRTKFGRYLYAVGDNTNAAIYTGISAKKVKFIVYVISGTCAGISGMLIASRMYTGTPNAGEAAEMDAIAAVVLGGTAMSGGSGRIGGTFIGCIIMGLISTGLNLMHIDTLWQDVIKGIVIIIAVYIDYIKVKNRIKNKHHRR